MPALYKKIFVLIFILSILLLTFDGCKNTKGENISTGDSQSDQTNSKMNKDKIRLSYWTMIPTQVQWQKVEPEWNKKYPNISVEYWTNSNREEMDKKRHISIAGGEGPDLLEVWKGSDLEYFSPMLEDIKPLADKNWGVGWESDYMGFAIDSCKDKKGTLVSLPFNIVAEEFVIINESLLDEIGVKGYKPYPKIYDEWKELCNKIRAASKDVIPVVYGGMEKWHLCDTFIYTANQFAPGKVYEAQEGKAKWGDKEFVDAMKAMKLLFSNIYQKGALGITVYPEARDQYFYSRKAAMFVTGSWHIGSYELPGSEKWGTKIENDKTSAFLSPQVGPYKPKPTYEVGDMIAINKKSKNKAAAWEFVQFMTKDKGAAIMADTIQGSPVRFDMKINSINQIKFQEGRDSVNWLLKILPTANGDMRFKYSDIQDALGTAVQNVVLGRPIEDELSKVQEISDKLDRN